jgi:hypothetical protein
VKSPAENKNAPIQSSPLSTHERYTEHPKAIIIPDKTDFFMLSIMPYSSIKGMNIARLFLIISN